MSDESNDRAIRLSDDEYRARVKTADVDDEFSIVVVEKVTKRSETLCDCGFVDGMCLVVEAQLRHRDTNAPRTRLPMAGDRLRLYGRGIGYEVRGIALHNTFALNLYRYETHGEMTVRRNQEAEDRKEEQRREWDAAKDAMLATVAKLPAPFQKRFEFFMRNPAWGPEFGKYELFVMTEAVKLADALKTTEALQAFTDAEFHDQTSQVPALARDHSGNTLGAATRLAYVYVREQQGADAEVFQSHGAMCPLVGCADYGCWATTDEAKAPRRKDGKADS